MAFILIFVLSLTFSILFHHHCRLFRSYSGILALWNTAYKRRCKTNARLKTWTILAGNMVYCCTCFPWSNIDHLPKLSSVLNFFALGYHSIGFNATQQSDIWKTNGSIFLRGSYLSFFPNCTNSRACYV